jgi:hypothetical protein
MEDSKRSINCLSSFMGRLVAAMHAKFPDFVVVFYTFNENFKAQNEDKALKEQPFPNSVQNLATHISFDADHIIVGDIYKNVTVLKVCDAEENKQEKLSDEEMINIKKQMGNRVNANVVSAYSLNHPVERKVKFGQRTPQLNEIERKLLTIFVASAEGYLRLLKVKD